MPSLTSGPALFIQPHMVTVFASELLPQMVGEFAAWKHERWKLTDPDRVLEARRAKDAAAARALGCDVRWLGLPDAIYRDRYTSDHELFGPLPTEEQEPASHLAEEIRHLPSGGRATACSCRSGSARMSTPARVRRRDLRH